MDRKKVSSAETSATQQEQMPTVPLPNPGEGGPVYSGGSNGMQDDEAVPVIPLPNPGEGGAVYPGNMGNIPNQGIGNIQGGISNILPNIIGTIISSYPRPNEQCRFCTSSNTRVGYLRFLNAATGYNPFVVFFNESMFTNSLNFAEVTNYERVSSGSQVITVMGENGYIFIQKRIEIPSNAYITIAIINTDSGIDLEVIEDNGCNRGTNMSCIRAANLANNSGALSVIIGNQFITFPNLRYRTVADFETIRPGSYVYAVTRNMMARFAGLGSNVLFTATLAVQRDRNYTIYLLNWKNNASDTIKALIVEDM